MPSPEIKPIQDILQQAYEQREALADYAHATWSGWMRYMLPILNPLFKAASWSPGDPPIDAAKVERALQSLERWMRQMETPYAELSEEEKASDRLEADTILAVVRQHHEP